MWCGKKIFVETISFTWTKYHKSCRILSDRHRLKLAKEEKKKVIEKSPKISTFVPMTDEEWYASDLYKKSAKSGGRI